MAVISLTTNCYAMQDQCPSSKNRLKDSLTTREHILLNFLKYMKENEQKQNSTAKYYVFVSEQIIENFKFYLQYIKIEKPFKLDQNQPSDLLKSVIEKIQDVYQSQQAAEINKITGRKSYTMSKDQFDQMKESLESLEFCKKKILREGKSRK